MSADTCVTLTQIILSLASISFKWAKLVSHHLTDHKGLLEDGLKGLGI